MNAMTLYYDPEVWHKKNLIFHFMNFNENLRNLSEREKKMTCISAFKSHMVLKMTSNCV